MNLTVIRKHFTDKTTIGELYIHGDLFCDTLEDTCRRDKNGDGQLQKGEKVFGETAIPAGKYSVILDYSHRYGRKMPRVIDVPHFTGILIHWGNLNAHTNGCILVGKYDPIQPDFIGNSRDTFNRLYERLSAGPHPITLTITGGLSAEQARTSV